MSGQGFFYDIFGHFQVEACGYIWNVCIQLVRVNCPLYAVILICCLV